MIFTEKEMLFILEAFKAGTTELTAKGKVKEVEYITSRVEEASKLTDKPKEYLEHLLSTFEYLQEVLND